MDLKQILTRRKASEHPRGANCWSQLLPIGLTRLEFSNHTLWPLLGLQGHQKGLFWPKRSLYGAPEGLRGPLGARFDPNCRQLVRLGWIHGYHTLWPGIGPFSWPPRGPFWPKMPLLGFLEVLGGSGGAIFGPNSLELQCLDWTHGYHRLWPGIEPLLCSNFDF